MITGLSVTSLTTGYDRRPAVHQADLEVESGSICAIVGPNGAGKTTLVSCIAGILPTWRGSIIWHGRSITKWSTRRRVDHGIAVVPQGAPSFPNLTVLQNLVVASRVRARGDTANARVAEAFKLFPELAERPLLNASSLSGGQRQMLAIGRALCQRPELLIVDEPSFGLAVGIRHRVVEALTEFRKETGGTVLLVEQDVNMVRQLADTAAFMSSGRLGSADPRSGAGASRASAVDETEV